MDDTQRRWFMGPFAFLFDDFVVLDKPVEALGHTMFWCFGSKQKILRELMQSYKETVINRGLAI